MTTPLSINADDLARIQKTRQMLQSFAGESRLLSQVYRTKTHLWSTNGVAILVCSDPAVMRAVQGDKSAEHAVLTDVFFRGADPLEHGLAEKVSKYLADLGPRIRAGECGPYVNEISLVRPEFKSAIESVRKASALWTAERKTCLRKLLSQLGPEKAKESAATRMRRHYLKDALKDVDQEQRPVFLKFENLRFHVIHADAFEQQTEDCNGTRWPVTVRGYTRMDAFDAKVDFKYLAAFCSHLGRIRDPIKIIANTAEPETSPLILASGHLSMIVMPLVR